jgi:predicted ribosome quality control (RQC) complex YloA/Tae2 family protein
MEGLLIAEELRRLEPQLPGRRLGWRFPDPHTFVLPLARGSLWLFNRPPDPRLELRDETPAPGRARTGFQDLLAARASGDLVAARQRKLDRVVTLEFAGGEGFVETPPVRLVVELTGRNSNLILLDQEDLVLGAAREIRADINRFRQVVSGRPYVAPPPYQKADPRSSDRAALRELLAGAPIRSWRQLVDGIGPQLSRALSASAGVHDERALEGPELQRALDALERLVEAPGRTVQEALQLPDPATVRQRERRHGQVERLAGELRRERELLGKRLDDLARARSAAEGAAELRRQGDLLLAYSNRVPEGADSVTLPDFSGRPVRLSLDPSLNGAANAQGYYERARKREARARQADLREPELRKRRAELDDLLGSLAELSDEELEELSERLLPAPIAHARGGPGARYAAPHGFTVLVGRNARENDQVTFKIARSRDVWLHVQGYRGSHVVILAENREVPFDTVIFAAQLAAAYSKAADSDNVPVDYTLRKNVWKVKGQSAGAVHFTRHKTVYVTPSRRPVPGE